MKPVSVRPNDKGEFFCKRCEKWHHKEKMKVSTKSKYGIEQICRRCEGFRQVGYRAKAKELKNLEFCNRFPNIQPGVKLPL